MMNSFLCITERCLISRLVSLLTVVPSMKIDSGVLHTGLQ